MRVRSSERQGEIYECATTKLQNYRVTRQRQDNLQHVRVSERGTEPEQEPPIYADDVGRGKWSLCLCLRFVGEFIAAECECVTQFGGGLSFHRGHYYTNIYNHCADKTLYDRLDLWLISEIKIFSLITNAESKSNNAKTSHKIINYFNGQEKKKQKQAYEI